MKTITTLLALGFLSLGGSGVYADDCSAPLSFDKRRLAGDEVVDYYTSVTSPESEKVVSAIEKLL